MRSVKVSVTGGTGVKRVAAPSIRPQTTKTIIDSIIQRRRMDHFDNQTGYREVRPGGFEAWLTGNVNPTNILEQVRSGIQRESLISEMV